MIIPPPHQSFDICDAGQYEAATANPLAVFFLLLLFTDIHVCGYKYPNKIISWLAIGAGTDPGMKGFREGLPRPNASRLNLASLRCLFSKIQLRVAILV